MRDLCASILMGVGAFCSLCAMWALWCGMQVYPEMGIVTGLFFMFPAMLCFGGAALIWLTKTSETARHTRFENPPPVQIPAPPPIAASPPAGPVSGRRQP